MSVKKASQDNFIRTALRVPPELHARIHDAAKESGRTFNAELVHRLERSFNPLGGSHTLTLEFRGNSDLTLEKMEEFVKHLLPFLGADATFDIVLRDLQEAEPTPPEQLRAAKAAVRKSIRPGKRG